MDRWMDRWTDRQKIDLHVGLHDFRHLENLNCLWLYQQQQQPNMHVNQLHVWAHIENSHQVDQKMVQNIYVPVVSTV